MKWSVIIWPILIAGLIVVAVEMFVMRASELALRAGETPIELFIPRPSDILIKSVSAAPVILQELAYTLTRAGLGLIIGLILAVAVTFISSLNKTIQTSSRLVAYSVNAFPLVGFAPLIVLVFGQGSEAGMVFLAMLLSYFPIYIALEHAISNVPGGLRDLGKVLDMSPKKEFRLILFPEMRGALLNSLRLAVPASIVGATIGEWLGAQHGVGRLVAISLYQFNAELMYSALAYLVVFNIIFLVVLWYLEKVFVIPRN